MAQSQSINELWQWREYYLAIEQENEERYRQISFSVACGVDPSLCDAAFDEAARNETRITAKLTLIESVLAGEL